MNTQHITIQTYEKAYQKYIDRTISDVTDNLNLETYIDAFIAKVSKDADILEIGSASGRDADYIEAKGYTVVRTDVVDAFINYQKARGKDITKFNAIDGDMGTQYDLIFANGVFFHFNAEEFDKALANVRRHLKNNGYFALIMKIGEGEKIVDDKVDGPRYFLLWTPEKLREKLESEGFRVEKIIIDNEKYMWCIAQI